MAGNYVDYPSYRIPYDKDGTYVTWIDPSNAVTALVSGDIAKLNDENDANAVGVGFGGYIALVFPRLMDIDAYLIKADFTNRFAATGALEGSPDTTNGLDGTWSSIASTYTRLLVSDPIRPAYRTGINSVTAGGLRGIRFKLNSNSANSGQVSKIHIFGEPSAGENTDMLAIWHPTLNQRVGHAYFDWGNVPRSSSADKQFRVKNLSPTLTAQAPRVALNILTDTTPSVAGWHTISKGAGFAAQQTLGDLAPGAISSEVCTLRRTTPSNAILSLWALRLFAESTTWT